MRFSQIRGTVKVKFSTFVLRKEEAKWIRLKVRKARDMFLQLLRLFQYATWQQSRVSFRTTDMYGIMQWLLRMSGVVCLKIKRKWVKR